MTSITVRNQQSCDMGNNKV